MLNSLMGREFGDDILAYGGEGVKQGLLCIIASLDPIILLDFRV